MRLGLGCLGMTEDFYGPSDETEAVATIHRALDLGVTLFDTADMYGPYVNEELLGRALKGRRDEAVIATKFGQTRDTAGNWTGVDSRPEHIREACDGSLRRLGVDHIDIYFQHRVDPRVPIEEVVGVMAELVAAGKVGRIGLCEVSAATLRRAHAVHHVSFVQSEYSLFSRDIEATVLPAMRALGVELMAYSPLGRGLLTGVIAGRQQIGGWRLGNDRFATDNIEHNLLLVDHLRRFAADRGVTPSQLALAWVLARGRDVTALFGTKRRAYLEANVAAAALELDADDLAALEVAVPVEAVAGLRADPGEINA